MKVLAFPSEDFSREELNKMSDDELWTLNNQHRSYCQQFCNEKHFQNAFNNGDVSDEWYIYFID